MTSSNVDPTMNVATQPGYESTVKLWWEGQRLQVRLLDECFLVAECGDLHKVIRDDASQKLECGLLVSEYGEDVPIHFEVQGTLKGLARCNFTDLPPNSTAGLNELITALKPLQSMATSHVAAGQKRPPVLHDPKLVHNTNRPTTKPIAIWKRIPMLAKIASAALAVVLMAAYVSAHVAHVVSADQGVVAAQTLTVTVPKSGHVQELLVSVGDDVEAGQVLAKLGWSAEASDLESVSNALESAQNRLQTAIQQDEDAKHTLKVAKAQIASDIARARDKFQSVETQLAAKRNELEKLAPLIKSQNIGKLEITQLKASIASLKADSTKESREIARLELAEEKAKRNVLVRGGQEWNLISNAEKKVQSASLAVSKLKRQQKAMSDIAITTDVVCEESGVVQAIHAREGQSLAKSEPALELNIGEHWVIGYVDASVKDQLKPGQDTEVAVPSKGYVLKGKIHQFGDDVVPIAKGDMPAGNVVPIHVKLDPLNAKVSAGDKVKISIKVGSKLRHWFRSILGGSNA